MRELIHEHERWSSKKLCRTRSLSVLIPIFPMEDGTPKPIKHDQTLRCLTSCVLQMAGELGVNLFSSLILNMLWLQPNCFGKFLRSVTGVNPSVLMLLLAVMILINIDQCRRTSRLAACVRKFLMANLALTCFDTLPFSRVMLFYTHKNRIKTKQRQEATTPTAKNDMPLYI